MHTLTIKNLEIGPEKPLTLIAGPCVAESRDLCLSLGQTLRDRCAKLGFNYIFKASYDKANRSSIHTPRGLGVDEGLRVLEEVGQELGVATTTDVHEPEQAKLAGHVVDLLQVPAFLCRQTDLLVACAKTGRAVNVKKGQFMSPAEMQNVIAKLKESDCTHIMLTERGTFFGYHRLVNDFVGLADMMDLNVPVCFDVTHSTQQPGAQGSASGGRPDRAPMLARCAVVSQVHALFIETHPNPEQAMSDSATMLPLERTLSLLDELGHLHQAMKTLPAH